MTWKTRVNVKLCEAGQCLLLSTNPGLNDTHKNSIKAGMNQSPLHSITFKKPASTGKPMAAPSKYPFS